MDVAFLTNKNPNSIDFLTIIKIVADLNLLKVKIFYKEEEVEKWIENVK